MFDKCLALLNERGVRIEDIIECVEFLQLKYYPDLSKEKIEECIYGVLRKREVQHAIITGIELDKQAERRNCVDKDLEAILLDDAGLYGIDEVMAYGICNLYGSIALTNYGFIDKVKPGIIDTLNNHDGTQCNTFLDDIVGAIAASAASKLAHTRE